MAHLGVTDYEEILEVQRKLNHLRNEGKIPDILIFNQHFDVYTVGIHRNPEEIVGKSIDPVQVERGGSVTYHGPGQIVVYFVISLLDRKTNVKELILAVQSAIIRALSEYGIDAQGRLGKETGVWIGDRKICSIGFAIRQSATFHGIALNVSTNLDKFGMILPCGFSSSVMTSMEKATARNISTEEVEKKLEKYLIDELKLENIKKISGLERLKQLLQ